MTSENENAVKTDEPLDEEERRKIKLRRIGTPYNAWETLAVLYRNAFGVNKRKNKHIVNWLPKTAVLNEDVENELTLGVVGDIMDMLGKRFVPGDDVIEFFHDCDFLLGNFEATITDSKGQDGVIYGIEQSHDIKIIPALKEVFRPEKFYLSVANNHAGDFGRDIFFKSVKMLQDEGFQMFGWKKKPFADAGDHLRFITGTQWSNQVCNYVARLKHPEYHCTKEGFNLLYPHWGNEHIIWPRPDTVTRGKDYLSRFGAVMGHHSHCPEPISAFRINEETDDKSDPSCKPVAFGLGDFCSGLTLKKYWYGIIVRLEIGRNNDNIWKVGKLHYEFTACRPFDKQKGTCRTNIIREYPYQS